MNSFHRLMCVFQEKLPLVVQLISCLLVQHWPFFLSASVFATSSVYTKETF